MKNVRRDIAFKTGRQSDPAVFRQLLFVLILQRRTCVLLKVQNLKVEQGHSTPGTMILNFYVRSDIRLACHFVHDGTIPLLSCFRIFARQLELYRYYEAAADNLAIMFSRNPIRKHFHHPRGFDISLQ